MKNIAFFEKKNIEGKPSGFETLRKLLDDNYFCFRVGEADVIPDLIVVARFCEPRLTPYAQARPFLRLTRGPWGF